MDSKRICTLILGVVVVFVMGSVVGAQRSAAEGDPFFDDFSDMNVEDNMPVTWTPFWPTGIDATSGDLVVTSWPPEAAAYAHRGGLPGPGVWYRNVSIRTQVRLLESESSDLVGVFYYDDVGGTRLTYAGGISPDGEIVIIASLVPGTSTDDIILASMATDLDVFNSDVHLRLDVFGDTLTLTAWADGTPEPGMPQLTVMAATPGRGPVGVFEQCSSPSTAVFRFVETRVPPEPEIDIKPWSDVNPVNPFARGVVPVAILGSDVFDVADVDVTSLAFGPDGASPRHAVGGHVKDVNADNVMDLLSHYRTPETGIAMGDTEACVTGETFDRMPFEACGSINTSPPGWGCGIGYELAFLLPPLVWMRQRRRRSNP